MKNNVNVLMVDDHPMIIEGYRNTLLENFKKPVNCVIDTAANCDEALALIKKNATKKPYDIAFIDIKMPVLSGEEVIRKSRNIGRDVYFVAVTAYYLQNESSKYINMGFDDAFVASYKDGKRLKIEPAN